jgi:TetR/AcrR family transcriptional regulator, transcriptional repressor for nem operon
MSSRDQIIEAARELLWEKGYVATSPRDIQKRANVGQGSMYHHFSGKEEIALEAISKSAEALRDLARKDMPEEGSSYDKISTYIHRDRNILQGCRMGRLTQDYDVIKSDLLRKPIEESFRWVISRMTRLIEEGIEQGEFIQTDAAAVATIISATLQGGYVLARAMNSEKPFHDAIKGLEILLGALRTSQE